MTLTIFPRRRQTNLLLGKNISQKANKSLANNISQEKANISSLGQQFFSGKAEKANISSFGQQYFPGEGNSGEKLAENWKLPSVTSTLRPVVNSNRTCAQSPHKFKLRAKSTQFKSMFGQLDRT